MFRLAPIEIVFAVIPLAILAYALIGNRPDPDRFATANDLVLDDASRDDVERALERTSRFRIGGACIGAAIGALIVAVTMGPALLATGLTAVLLGTLIGIGISPFHRADPPGALRSASLTVRCVDDHRPPRARFVLRGLLLLIVVFAIVVASGATDEIARTRLLTATVLAIGLSAWVGGAWLQRRIVERTRERDDPAHLRVDDALRSSAVRAVHHAVVGVLLCVLALVGVVGVTSQTFVGVDLGGHTVFHAPAGATVDSVENLTPEGSAVATVRIRWTDADGRRHETVRSAAGDATITMGDLWANVWILSFGFWCTTIGFLGALYQWGRASKAWRRPARRTVPPQTPAPPVRTLA